MSDTLVDPELEDRVRRAMHSLAESHHPAAAPSKPPASEEPSRRRVLVLAAAALLLLGGIAALFAVAGRDDDPEPSATEPPAEPEVNVPEPTAPDPAPDTTAVVADPAPTGVPNATGDVTIDPAGLRFAEPLPDGVVAFLDAFPDLEPAVVRETPGFPAQDDPGDSARFVALDGPHLLVIGNVVDASAEAVEVDGDAVDIGIEGARWADAAMSAIAIPTGDRVRIIGPTDYFTLAARGPFVDPAVMTEVAAAIGTTPLGELADVPGIHPMTGTVDGEPLDTPIDGDSITVDHGGLPSPSVTLVRLDEPPTALDLAGIAYGVARELTETPQIGDVTFSGTGPVYVELVSPVDLVIVATSLQRELDELLPRLDVAPLDELDTAYDGTVEAPPAPTGPAAGEPVPEVPGASAEPQSIAVLEPAPGELIEIYDQSTPLGHWVAGIESRSSIVELNGDDFEAAWFVYDIEQPWDPSRYSGPSFESVDGVEARWFAAEKAILAVERPEGTRIVTGGDGSDPTDLLAAIGGRAVPERIADDELVVFPGGDDQLVAVYATPGLGVMTYRAPEGSAKRVASAILGPLAASSDTRDLGGGVFVSTMEGGGQAILVPTPDGRVAVVTTPDDRDPGPIAESVVVRPVGDLGVPILAESVLDELVARAETGVGRRFELRTGSDGTEPCWSLDVGSAEPSDGTPIFGESSGGVRVCGPESERTDPLRLCVGAITEIGAERSASGVIEGDVAVAAFQGSSPVPVDVAAVDGWTFFHADALVEDPALPILLELDGQRTNC